MYGKLEILCVCVYSTYMSVCMCVSECVHLCVFVWMTEADIEYLYDYSSIAFSDEWSFPESVVMRCVLSFMVLYMYAEDPNSSPCPFTPNILPTEPSLQCSRFIKSFIEVNILL